MESRYFKIAPIVVVAITWASLTSQFPELPDAVKVPFYDKWGHFVMYGVLTLAAQWDCRGEKRRGTPLPVTQWTLVCAVLPTVWGVLMELGQAYLTTCRTGDALDALANTVGVAIGLVCGISLFGRTWGQSSGGK